ncbi:MAG: NTP transferase domain-containing protein [Thermodesulfobacteriota bacterium]|nr:NTP transferase domain-containing protein [Thermodesulfobacteriota bacterium]
MAHSDRETAIVILAAGLGTRMKSDKAKVLHEIMGKPMVHYVLEASLSVVDSRNIIVVIGCQAEQVRSAVTEKCEVRFANQPEQLGTGHAVQCALSQIPENVADVIILCGDVPFISARTIDNLLARHREAANVVTVLSVNLEEPRGYGRIIVAKGDTIERIVEEADASDTEKAVTLVNAGIYCVKSDFLAGALSRLNTDNQQKELYLTDIVAIASSAGQRVGTVISPDPAEVIGVNSVADLKLAETLFRKRSM